MNDSKQKSLFGSEFSADEPAVWEEQARADRLAALVVLNRPLHQSYSYLVPDELRPLIGLGQRVRVPFGKGNRLITGYCVGLERPSENKRTLKTIESLIDRTPLLSGKMLQLTRWIAEHTLCGWGQVLESVVPAGVKQHAGTRLISCFRPAPDVAERIVGLKLTAKQQAALDAVRSADQPLSAHEISELVGCGTGPITALRDKGLVQAIRRRTSQFTAESHPVARQLDLKLNREQQTALGAIVSQLQSGTHRTMVLRGVTGSGKTEVYIQAIREVVSYGRQAIVLVPEISLTPQTIRRFRSRFDSVAVLHSHLTDSERHWHWQQIARGAVQVVVGARSAVFAPTPQLGLIVIDEEHETSFKQETTPRYHAREVARERSRLEGVPLVLGSATPTLESWLRVQQNLDSLITIKHRVERRPLPPVVIVDVRHDQKIVRGEALGRALETAMRAALADEGQIILLLNLRGFSTVLWCRRCGEAVKCPHCDISLTWHMDKQVVMCHTCDHQESKPSHCPRCEAGGMRYFGTGTQRLEQEVRAKFRGVSCLRMDSDSMQRPGSHDKALEAFRSGEVRILLGTQMIAKGLDFPNVTLVGVVDADTVLHQPDLRAAERTFQLVSQVAGRTGRSERGGRVLVQTSAPGEPAIQKAAEHDYLGFVKPELQHRRERCAPPFYRLARIILRGSDEAAVRERAAAIALSLRETAAQESLGVQVRGPAPAPVTKIKGHFRYHVQLSAQELEPILKLWMAALDRFPSSNQVEFVIDVDPLNLR